MRYIWLHARANTVEIARMPMYWVPAMLFPLLFFALFGIAQAKRLADIGLGGEYVLTPFLLFTTLNVTLSSLAAGIAAERSSTWERRLRLLPTPVMFRFLGRLAHVLVFNAVTWVPLLAMAAVLISIDLPAQRWPLWIVAVTIGALPFGLLGIAVGYRFPVQAASMIANVLMLVLCFVGGLFVPLEALPAVVRTIGSSLPSHAYLELTLATLGGDVASSSSPLWNVGLLLIWTVAFALVAWLAHRRDEGERYG